MFILPALPYAAGALAPTLSEGLMQIHHGKHHKAYVDNLNKLLADAGKSPATLEEVIVESGAARPSKVFNNSAQMWNHGFFWECMTPDHAAPGGALVEAIERDFGGLDALKTRFIDEGVNHFASGWAWIVSEGGKLSVISTHDADTPVAKAGGPVPILVCDVWEHAYYLDHKQDRKGFLTQWFDNLANWRFAEAQYAASLGQADGWVYPPPTAG